MPDDFGEAGGACSGAASPADLPLGEVCVMDDDLRCDRRRPRLPVADSVAPDTDALDADRSAIRTTPVERCVVDGLLVYRVRRGLLRIERAGQLAGELGEGDVAVVLPGTAHRLDGHHVTAMLQLDRDSSFVPRAWSGAVGAIEILQASSDPEHADLGILLDLALETVRERAAGWREVVAHLGAALLLIFERARARNGAVAPIGCGSAFDERLARALHAVHDAPERAWTVPVLARLAGLSRSAFVRRFHAACGMSPGRYVQRVRLQRARHLLEQGSLSNGEVADRVGYASVAAFGRAYKSRYGEPPARLRRAARNRRPA